MNIPSQETILAELAAIRALAERMRNLTEPPCPHCTPERKCWFHTPMHEHAPR